MTRSSRRATRPARAPRPVHPTRAALARLSVAGLTAGATLATVAMIPSADASEDGASGVAASHARAGAGAQIADLKRSLRPYQSVDRALADGFVPVSECTESPEGGMGLHYLNPARAAAPVDPGKPAILLYGPNDRGGLRLLGAEWFQADADQDLATDEDRPALWGRPFEGPMPGHDPMMPVHYDLHVWVYDSNPAGVFAPWNPSVSC